MKVSTSSKKYWAYSVLSGLLLFFSWPPYPLAFLIVLGFVPLFLIAESTNKGFFKYVFTAMLIWNIGATWWVCNSTLIGGISAIIANSLLMCIPWIANHKSKQFLTPITALVGFISIWLYFEYIHLNWELSWPWLTLGNVFANNTHFIQWYSYTGVAGGSLFILLENILLLIVITKWHSNKNIKNWLPFAGLFFVIPFLLWVWSNTLERKNYQPLTATKNIVAIQPNVNAYEKFSIESASQQINNLIQLSEKAIDTNTVLILWPETAMSVGEWQNLVAQNRYYQPVFAFMQKHPSVTLISGIETFKNYGNIKETITAKQTDIGTYYDNFNAAIKITAGSPLEFYNKSKLVPGVEALPSFLQILSPVFEKFGGSTGGYGKSAEAAVFTSADKNYIAAPIICYESIYGDYIRTYVEKKATLLSIITNDGWWGNTPGYQQHLAYAKLRAIENNRWVIRSANTGVSAIIDNKGNILQSLGWDKQGFVKANIPLYTNITAYTKHGDIIYFIAEGAAVTVLLILLYMAIVQKLFSKNKKK